MAEQKNDMTGINPEYIALDKEMQDKELDGTAIDLLEKIKQTGRVWDDLCGQYGVENPDPPWKVTLEATCDVMSEEACAEAENCTLPALERRWEEDQLAEELYSSVPNPERQLLALAHTMIRRGLIKEDELANHMKVVDKRLNMA